MSAAPDYRPDRVFAYEWSRAAGTERCRSCGRDGQRVAAVEPEAPLVSIVEHPPCLMSGGLCQMHDRIDACCGAIFGAGSSVGVAVCWNCLLDHWGDAEARWQDGSVETPAQRVRRRRLVPVDGTRERDAA
jgi:hypothetical protein